MATTLQRLQAVTVQDVVLVTVCVLSVYLLRVHQALLLTPAWKKHVPVELYHNGRYPFHDEILPLPVITDLDSDGLNEIVLITNGLHLEVLGYQTAVSGSLLPDLVVHNYIKLPSTVDKVTERIYRPIALATGYLRKAASDEQLNQVIVVALDNWEVLCFDNELRLLWRQQHIGISDLAENYFVKSFAVLIIPQNLRGGDNGMVIVGGNFVYMDQSDTDSEDGDTSGGHGSKNGQHLERFIHFTTYALEGSTGKIRWQHLPEPLQNRSELKKYHHWKLAIHGGEIHPGEAHWSKFGTNMLKLMPHSWNKRVDTRMQLKQLHKLDPLTSDDGSGESATILSDIFGIDNQHLSDWVRPGDKDKEDTAKPNAVVIHYDRGVQVLHLHNGMSATHVRMNSGHVAYADIDTDGTLDMVEMEFTPEKCLAYVSSIYPHQRELFVEQLCDEATWWGFVSFASAPTPEDIDTIDVTPVIVKRIAQPSGILSHIVGTTFSSETKGCDSIFATRNGYVTSYGPSGEFNWQTTVEAEWTTVLSRHMFEFRANELGNVYNHAFEPSLIPFSPETRSSQQTAVLVTGWDYLTVVDLRDGFILASHSLPCHPLSQPVLGDYSGDGWTDIIIICPDKYVGFTIHRHGNYVYTSVVAVTVILTILLLNWCCQPDKYPHCDDTCD